MTVSEIGILRLKNLINGDEGLKQRELYIVEKEIKKVLDEYFCLRGKEVYFNFAKNDCGITINILAEAEKIKSFSIL